MNSETKIWIFIIFFFIVCYSIAITLSSTINREKSQECIVHNVYTDGKNAIADVEILRLNRMPYNANVVKYCDQASDECISSFIEEYAPFIGNVKKCFFPINTYAREGIYLYEANKSYNDRMTYIAMGLFIAGPGLPFLIIIIYITIGLIKIY